MKEPDVNPLHSSRGRDGPLGRPQWAAFDLAAFPIARRSPQPRPTPGQKVYPYRGMGSRKRIASKVFHRIPRVSDPGHRRSGSPETRFTRWAATKEPAHGISPPWGMKPMKVWNNRGKRWPTHAGSLLLTLPSFLSISHDSTHPSRSHRYSSSCLRRSDGHPTHARRP